MNSIYKRYGPHQILKWVHTSVKYMILIAQIFFNFRICCHVLLSKISIRMKFVVLILLLGIFGLNWTSGYDGDETDSVSGCPKVLKKCKCGRQRTNLWHPERNDTYVVNCTNKNYQNSTPLQQIPKETEVLIMIRCSFYVLLS